MPCKPVRWCIDNWPAVLFVRCYFKDLNQHLQCLSAMLSLEWFACSLRIGNHHTVYSHKCISMHTHVHKDLHFHNMSCNMYSSLNTIRMSNISISFLLSLLLACRTKQMSTCLQAFVLIFFYIYEHCIQKGDCFLLIFPSRMFIHSSTHIGFAISNVIRVQA
jgi:hypothetical protein